MTISHGYWTSAVAWSPDGKRLAAGFGTASEGANIVIYDSASGEKQQTIHITDEGYNWVQSMAWSPDGKLLACGASGAFIWDKANWKQIGELDTGENSTTNVAWAPDSNLLSIGAPGQNNVYLWDISQIK